MSVILIPKLRKESVKEFCNCGTDWQGAESKEDEEITRRRYCIWVKHRRKEKGQQGKE